jgi:hypothetical protein
LGGREHAGARGHGFQRARHHFRHLGIGGQAGQLLLPQVHVPPRQLVQFLRIAHGSFRHLESRATIPQSRAPLHRNILHCEKMWYQ